ncbi:MAG: hypothetical protein QOG15_3849 [Solirubrobacteraceae bacterium]|nr:hypothetical protein [Solirubrobacteraceae bacterium]
MSEYAAIQFARAVRLVGGLECESCRAEKGRVALQQAINAPAEPLPDHWLDRAIALRTDQTRSADEKLADGQLPGSLSVADIVQEFLRRIDKQPHERAQVIPGTLLHRPEFAEGWKVYCLREEFTQQYPDGSTQRHPLPLLVTPDADVLAPPKDANQQNLMSSTWEPVYDHEIDLDLLVNGVANILVLSRFDP